ncbi:hypothetical protein D9611_015091 [Ephemerocybe angulata]|uniref:Uncharacterized protein n=1 Tax=Ephemerocybe angulata TaxID=980116 RepID=A0A8H5AQ89_9AGAR|nr:hypothetical protein D9611_015091 [Tulosesus angulatus]
MNHQYDVDKATRLLGDIGKGQLQTIADGFVSLAQAEYPPSTRIMDGEDEVVFKVQGVMCGKLLPPFTESPIRNLRQHVKTVHDAFAQHARDREVDQIEFIPYEGHQSLEVHSRYFTDRALVPYEKNQAFLPGVDPFDVLRKLQPDEFIHAADNVVEYCVRAVANGVYNLRPLRTQRIQGGRRSRGRFLLRWRTIKGQRMRILLQLRGLTLLDNTIRKESERTTRMTMALVALNRTPRREEVISHRGGEGEIIEVEGSDGSSTVGGGEGDGDGAAEGEADGEGEGGGDVEGNEGEDDSAEAVSGGELEEGEMLPDLPDSDDEDVHGVEGEGGGDDAAEAGERGDAMNVDWRRV